MLGRRWRCDKMIIYIEYIEYKDNEDGILLKKIEME